MQKPAIPAGFVDTVYRTKIDKPPQSRYITYNSVPGVAAQTESGQAQGLRPSYKETNMETVTPSGRRPFPTFAILPTLLSIASNFLFYSLPMALCGELRHFDFTTALDRAVPLLPIFTPIYLSFFVVWFVNFILIGYRGKEAFYRFLTADLMGRLACTLLFILLPTMNVRPAVEGDTVFCWLLSKVVYENDSATNLFPSVHCYVSWLCFLGVSAKGSPLPKWYQVFLCVYVCLILVATQVLKQHVMVDLVSAVLLAYGMLWLSSRIHAYRYLQSACQWLNQMLRLSGTPAEP